MRFSWAPGLVGACLIAGGLARGDVASRPLALADDISLGPDRYLANTTSLAIAPAAGWSVDLTAGVTATTTPAADTTRSLGVAARVDASPAVALGLGYTAFTGDLSTVYAFTPPSAALQPLDPIGTVDDRQQFQTLSGSVTARLLDPDAAAEDGGDWRPQAKLTLGTAVQTQTLPLWQALNKGEWKKFGTFQSVDNAYQAGLALTVRRTGLGFSYTRHHYTGVMNLGGNPTVQQQAIALAVLQDLHTSTGSPIAGVAVSDAEVTLSQPLPEHLTASAAYLYTELQATADAPDAENLARTTDLDLAWDPWGWLEARAGVSWLLQAGTIGTYVKAGCSVFY